MPAPRTTPTALSVPELVAAVVEDHADTLERTAAENGTSRITEATVLVLRRDAKALRSSGGES